eukprot:maker-scaffold594_size129171-snap-gene-0.19 protein:Tk01957 transcript:maker-scaffold594_size129171-snap-gene-0.19-mRNA-1 annotation:"nadh dehydrogenase 1 alpha subcomplex 13"
MADGKIHTTDVARPFKQDLPPKGGYAPITYKRIPARTVMTAPMLLGGLIGLQSYGYYAYKKGQKVIRRNELEMTSASLGIEPLLLAERDREFLKQIRRNRDAETELMKDREGWEVGTLFGEKIYLSIPEDSLDHYTMAEYYAHAHPKLADRDIHHRVKVCI